MVMRYGRLLALTAVFLSFLATAAVVYFVFVAPMNHLKGRLTKRQEEAAETSAEELLGEIRDLLKEQNAAK